MHDEFSYLDLLGREFEYGARGPDRYDCYGLMIEMRHRVGLFMPEDYASTNLPDVMHHSIEHARHVFPFHELPVPRPFCLVTFKLHPKYTTHIGMVLGDCSRFIHILPKLRVAVERLDSPCWNHRVTGFWEVLEIRDGDVAYRAAKNSNGQSRDSSSKRLRNHSRMITECRAFAR